MHIIPGIAIGASVAVLVMLVGIIAVVCIMRTKKQKDAVYVPTPPSIHQISGAMHNPGYLSEHTRSRQARTDPCEYDNANMNFCSLIELVMIFLQISGIYVTTNI